MNYQKKLDLLWQEISNRKIFKFKNFFKDLYLLQKYDLRFINSDKINLHFDQATLPNCAKCPQNCCRGAENTVSLRLIDIARLLDGGLAAAIDLNNQEFKKDPYFKKNKKMLSKVNNDSWNFFPVLKRVNNICPYLDKENRCTIYKYRPLTCRRFPYILTETKKDIVFSKKCYQPIKIINLEKQTELLKSAVDSYNERVKDLILISYARKELAAIGLKSYLLLKK